MGPTSTSFFVRLDEVLTTYRCVRATCMRSRQLDAFCLDITLSSATNNAYKTDDRCETCNVLSVPVIARNCSAGFDSFQFKI